MRFNLVQSVLERNWGFYRVPGGSQRVRRLRVLKGCCWILPGCWVYSLSLCFSILPFAHFPDCFCRSLSIQGTNSNRQGHGCRRLRGGQKPRPLASSSSTQFPDVTFAVVVGHGKAEQICAKAMKSTYGTRCIDSLHLVGALHAAHVRQEGFRDCSAFASTCHSEELLPHSEDREREGSSKHATHLSVTVTSGPKLELTWMLGLVTGHDLRQGRHVEIDMEDVKRLQEAVDELWLYLQLHARFFCILQQ